MDLTKYKNKSRILLIKSPNYKLKDYLNIKHVYQKHIKKFHKRHVKLITKIDKKGFKNKEKALYTVNTIKNRPIKYQVNVIATMLGRAKKHPHRTQEMKDAIKVFSKWMSNYKKNFKK